MRKISNMHKKYEITGYYSTYIYIRDDNDNKVCFHYSILKDLIEELEKAEQICIDNWKKINEEEKERRMSV